MKINPSFFNSTEKIPGGILKGADFSSHTGSMKVLESFEIVQITDFFVMFVDLVLVTCHL